MPDAPQRAYRAACPGCGAAVEFRSLASTHAVCSFCQSTIVRDGDALSRIGKMSEVFDDYSPLQLFSQGKFNSQGFTVVGRLQYKTESATWSEWLCALDDGSTASLGEDNGSFVWSVAANTQRTLPKPEQWVIGNLTAINGRSYSVASMASVALMSAQGELPKLPPLGKSFTVVELRSAQGEVISVDYSTEPPALSSGVSVVLDNLQLTGLRDLTNATGQGGKELIGRHFNCPNCGNAISVKLEISKSITCGACNSLMDLSQGIGSELKHAIQDEPIKPLIALGSVGTLQGKSWQIVGFQHRMGHETGDDSDDDGYDESFGWSEYLLYNAKAGFQFLVDAEDGWSLVKPTTGAPVAKSSRLVTYQGASYTQQYTYKAETNYVAGEFYWRVERGQQTHNEDYANGKLVLSREQSAGSSGQEVTWSIGSKLEAATVASAFKLQSRAPDFQRSASGSDVGPTSTGSRSVQVVFWVLVVLIFLFFEFRGCMQRDCDPQRENCATSARSSGGSYGGYSSGGGHK
jgi:ribosomal protein S27E